MSGTQNEKLSKLKTKSVIPLLISWESNTQKQYENTCDKPVLKEFETKYCLKLHFPMLHVSGYMLLISVTYTTRISENEMIDSSPIKQGLCWPVLDIASFIQFHTLLVKQFILNNHSSQSLKHLSKCSGLCVN